MNVRIPRNLKEKLPCAIDKHLQVISNIMLFKAVTPLRNYRIMLYLTYWEWQCFTSYSRFALTRDEQSEDRFRYICLLLIQAKQGLF